MITYRFGLATLVGAALAVLSLAGSTASAGVTTLFTITPDAILTGNSAHLDLQLNLTADSGYFNPNFSYGDVTLYSGDGASQQFLIGSGGTSRDFSVDFTYSTAGVYHPGFFSEVITGLFGTTPATNYTENYHYWGVTGYYESCYNGFLTHYCNWYPQYGWLTGTTGGSISYAGSGTLTVTDPLIQESFALTAAPELSTWAMMLIGFAGVGFVAYRRTKKGSAAIAAA